MDGIQAAVLRIKLRHLEKGNELRRSHAARYNRYSPGFGGLITPYEDPSVRHVYHIYAIRIRERDEPPASRRERYCVRNPLSCASPSASSVFGSRLRAGFNSGCGAGCKEFISLPMFPELTAGQVETVIEGVKEVIASGVVT